MTTRFIDHLLEGDHASRPAFGDVPQGTLYSCTTHSLIYQSDGTSAWSTWATLGAAVNADDVTFDPTGLDNTAATDVQVALEDYDAAITAASGSGGAPSDAKYIVTTANGGLSAEIPRPELDDYATSGGSDITFTSPTDENANLTSTTETDMLRKITCVNTTVYHCYVSSAIGTGDFDIRARIADLTITVPHTAASLPLLGLFVADSSLTVTTRLSIFGQWPATTNLEHDYVAASSNTLTVINQKGNGVKLPVILRIRRTSTTVTFEFSTNEGRVWSLLGTATSSLNIARLGFYMNGGSVGSGATTVALIHWLKSF